MGTSAMYASSIDGYCYYILSVFLGAWESEKSCLLYTRTGRVRLQMIESLGLAPCYPEQSAVLCGPLLVSSAGDAG
jgi:hypothetical protein